MWVWVAADTAAPHWGVGGGGMGLVEEKVLVGGGRERSRNVFRKDTQVSHFRVTASSSQWKNKIA